MFGAQVRFLCDNTRMKRRSPTTKGFTLVEMIVATGIFTVAILILVGALISLTNESRKTRAIRAVSDNLGSAIESMTRSMRMGKSFYCGCGTPSLTPQSCSLAGAGVGASCIAFIPQNAPVSPGVSDMVVYRYNATDRSIERSTQGGAVGTFLRYTAPEVQVQDLKFYVNGATAAQDQPFITITLRASAGTKDNVLTEFNIQTSVSARSPNF